jgi:hypothetical protein
MVIYHDHHHEAPVRCDRARLLCFPLACMQTGAYMKEIVRAASQEGATAQPAAVTQLVYLNKNRQVGRWSWW